jgi:predicted dehydrogenase
MIALPPAENAEAAAFFLGHGVPVLCEKPIAADVAAARRLAVLGEHRTHAVDFQFAELPAFLCARESLIRGDIGRVNDIQLTWVAESYAVRNRLRNWKREADGAAGGVLPLLASHALYLMEWLNGPINSIGAELAAEGAPWSSAMPAAPDTAELCAVFASGSSLTAEISNAVEGQHLHCWRFAGERGELRIENPFSDYMSGFSTTLTRDGGTQPLSQRSSNSNVDGRIPPFLSLARRFFAAVRSSQPTYPDFRSGWRVQCAIDACIKSHIENRVVRISECQL